MTLTHWKKFHNPDYLGAYALEPGKEMILTIKSVGTELVPGPDGKKEDLMVAHFVESGSKPMILNVTNCKTISKLYGNYVEEWAGKKVQIFVTEVQAFGQIHDCLRIRSKAPAAPRGSVPELTPDHEKWAGAVEAIKAGRQTIEGVKNYFALSPENEEKLKAQVIAADTSKLD